MLRFWSSKLQFWRKSRRKASFLSFKALILKEVSQKCFVFDFQSFNFEGSLEEMLRFWSSKLQFCRKSRRNVSFLSFKALILKENASFLIFKALFLKEVSKKSFVFELQSFVFEGRLAQKLRLTKSFESHIIGQPNHLNLKIIWHPNHLNLKSIDRQLIWISNRLTTKSLESQINWQPNHLNLKSNDNHITWSSNQQTTKIIWSTHRLTTSNQLTTKIVWISNQMTTKSFDSQLVWIWHQLTFEPIELRTLPSYRFLIFGNFRHRLVR